MKKDLTDKTPVTKGSSFVWFSSYHYKEWVLLLTSDSQTEFSKQLSNKYSKTLFYFLFWFSDNLVHKFLEKVIFHSTLLVLPLLPICTVWFYFSDLLAEQESFFDSTLATLRSRGGERGYFNWKEKGRGNFGILENGLLSHKPIPRWW